MGELYPNKNIIVFQGENVKGEAVIDQLSIEASTNIAQIIKGKMTFKKVTPKDFSFDFKPLKDIETTGDSVKNLKEFLLLLAGTGSKSLEQVVAMEVSLNLFGLGIVDDLKKGVILALEAIHSGTGLDILRNLIVCSGGDIKRFNELLIKS